MGCGLMEKKTHASLEVVRAIALVVFFGGCAVLGYIIFGGGTALASKNALQQVLYPLGLGVMLSGLLTAMLAMLMRRGRPGVRPVWFYPALAALLTFCGLGIAYIFLGIWPIGEKTCLMVDMHHQYAPMLAKLREMLLSGDSFLYSFELGMGASFLPAFAYYLASPLNLLLVFFPENLLAEGIFVITMLKNVLIAAAAAMCLQYVYRRRSPAVAAVAVMYSMMMYVLAYSWNIMWLDGVMMLPLVVMGFEHLMRRGKYLPYVLSLAYALYANYYIAFMLCVFLVLYFLAFLLRDARAPQLNRRSLWRFTAGSLLGGGLAMLIVLPTALALGQTSAAGSSLPDMAAYFDMFNLLGRQLYAVSPTIRSGNLPNIYCGVAVLLLVPLFAVNGGIPRRRRLTYLALLAVMTFCLILNQPNLFWHGLHTPNDLPYRFSFIYCFVLLLLGYETLVNLQYVQVKQLGASFLGVLVYLALEERFGDDKLYGFQSIYVTLLLVALYALICFLIAHRSILRRAGQMLLLTVVMAEMTLNASQVIIKLNNQEHYTAHSNYVDNAEATAIEEAVSVMKEAAADDGFARMEFLPRRTCMDTALFRYPGITSFASSNSYRTTSLMGGLGYAVNGVNSYLYKSFIPMTDSLLGVRYVALQSDISNHTQLRQIDRVSATDDNGGSATYYIYENTAALPIAYRANGTVRDWASYYYNPVVSINTLYESMTGETAPLLEEMPISSTSGSVTLKEESASGFRLNTSGTATAVFEATAAADGQYFIYVDCRGAESINVKQGGNSWSMSTGEPYFIDAGTLMAGDTVEVTVSAKSTCSGNVFVLHMNADVFERAVKQLSVDGLQVTAFSDARITGTVNASADGAMVTSIPYDAGWTVTVDGKKVETYGLDTALPDRGSSEPVRDENGGAAMLGFDIPAGEHTVCITFRTRGLTAGLLLSGVSLLLLVLMVLFTGRLSARVANTRAAWLFDTASLDPGDPYRPMRAEDADERADRSVPPME